MKNQNAISITSEGVCMENRIKVKIDDCIWLMDDKGEATGYLVCGEGRKLWSLIQ